jgi:HPt (histidine-containing phosphotransfer) domain-containing protein
MKPEDFYDIEVLKRSTGNDPAFLKHMVQLFIEQAPLQFNELKAAVESNDYEAVGKTAHKMKSSLRSMGIHSLVDDAVAFEKDGKAQTHTETFPERLAHFEAKLITTLEFLSQEL